MGSIKSISWAILFWIAGSVLAQACDSRTGPVAQIGSSWIIVKSANPVDSRDVSDLLDLYQLLLPRWPCAEILRSKNGFLALALGTVPEADGQILLQDWISSARIPADSFLSKGNRLIARVPASSLRSRIAQVPSQSTNPAPEQERARTPSELIRIHKALTLTRDYIGPVLDYRTSELDGAIRSFQEEWLEEQPTGTLDDSQLMRLFKKERELKDGLGMTRVKYHEYGLSVELPLKYLGSPEKYDNNVHYPPVPNAPARDSMYTNVWGGYINPSDWNNFTIHAESKYRNSVINGYIDQGDNYIFIRYFDDLPGGDINSFDVTENISFFFVEKGEMRGVEMTWITGRRFIDDKSSRYFFRHRFTAAAIVNSIQPIPIDRGTANTVDPVVGFIVEELAKFVLRRTLLGLGRKLFK